MAEVNKVTVNGTTYDIRDNTKVPLGQSEGHYTLESASELDTFLTGQLESMSNRQRKYVSFSGSSTSTSTTNNGVPFSRYNWFVTIDKLAVTDGRTWAVVRMHTYSAGHSVQRIMENGVWGEWLWENPPLTEGVEYCTTENYDGKSVYTKLINHGTAASDTAAITLTGCTIIRYSARCGGRIAPYNTTADNNASMFEVDVVSNKINFRIGETLITEKAPILVQVWYYKVGA